MIKRYDIDLDGFDNLRCKESKNGEYVLFDDAANLISARDAAIRAERDRLRELLRWALTYVEAEMGPCESERLMLDMARAALKEEV